MAKAAHQEIISTAATKAADHLMNLAEKLTKGKIQHITKAEAQALIKAKADNKYRNSTKVRLLAFLTNEYNKFNPDMNFQGKEIVKTISKLTKELNVGATYLYELFNEMGEFTYHRHKNKFYFTMNYQPLLDWEITESTLTDEQKAKQAGKTAKARAKKVEKAKVAQAAKDLETFNTIAKEKKEDFYKLMLGKLKQRAAEDYEDYGMDAPLLSGSQIQDNARQQIGALMQ